MSAKKLHVDIETFSSIDITTSGMYKYTESVDFEILMIAYAIDNNPIQMIDLVLGDKLPREFVDNLLDESVEKWAHNANFERQSFKQIGFDIPVEQWHCTAIKAAYCGLPLGLDAVSKALKLEDKGKSSTGKALIKYFCCPIKPTKVNGGIKRNFPGDSFVSLEKWEEFKLYCMQDVEAEREIDNRLEHYEMPDFERRNYILDQKINDRGVLIDLDMAKSAIKVNDLFAKDLSTKIKNLTGVENSNSAAQLKKWLEGVLQKEIKSLAKDTIPDLIKESESDTVKEVLRLRQMASRTSIKKYLAMVNCACYNTRAHGLFQFYGANRTGRWAGRLIQLQNLRRNYIKDIDLARETIKQGDYDYINMLYEDVADLLSQLIRTAIKAKENHTFTVADFSAIEARVIAWLANEQWRLDVFNTHGKIYEASASMMFNIPLESITKGSPERDKGKVAELALGYGGSLGALRKMGGEDMGLSDPEMTAIVKKWRLASPAIVKFWKNLETCAIKAYKKKERVASEFGNIFFDCNDEALTIELPSGKKLFYRNPSLTENQWGAVSLRYKGMNQVTKQWEHVDTYGGKLAENIVQAVARDLLAEAMLRLDKNGFPIAMHVHDEVVAEVLKENSEITLEKMCSIMGEEVSWAKGLRLPADGYITEFYKKD